MVGAMSKVSWSIRRSDKGERKGSSQSVISCSLPLDLELSRLVLHQPIELSFITRNASSSQGNKRIHIPTLSLPESQLPSLSPSLTLSPHPRQPHPSPDDEWNMNTSHSPPEMDPPPKAKKVSPLSSLLYPLCFPFPFQFDQFR